MAIYTPNSKELDGKQLYYSFLAGAQRIFDNQKLLNKINVFPVADADTGTNLASTMRSIIDTNIPTDNIKITANALADAALVGARGNSGIIFAQFLYGFSNEIKSEKSLSVETFKEIIKEAVKYAYDSIANPVEGTMITVLREWSEGLDAIHEKVDEFKQLITESYQSAKISLAETTGKLEVLAKNNVVDAGAKGFVVFLEGMIDFFKHEEIKKILPTRNVFKFQSAEAESINHDEITFRYCTEAMLTGTELEKAKLKKMLEPMGDSLVIAGSPSKLRIHIHTDEPSLLFEKINTIGDITFQKVDDMVMQKDVMENRKNDIALMTDSTCDLPPEIIEKHQIHVVPLSVHMGNTYFLDRVTLDAKRFYNIFDSLKERPTTAQPAFKEFSNKLSYLSTHYKSVIGMHINASMSGTHSNASRSAKSISWQMKKRIDIIDSKKLTSSLGLLVLRLAEAIESKQYSHDELIELGQNWVNKSDVFVSVKTLKYIAKSGRVSPIKGFIGNLLNLKPIITIDNKGVSSLLEKSFTEEGSMKNMMKHAKQTIAKGELWGYAITHANNPTTADWYKDELTKLTGQKPKFMNIASPVLGANVGPGVVAVSFLLK